MEQKRKTFISTFLLFLRYFILCILVGAVIFFAAVLFSAYTDTTGTTDGGPSSFALGYAIFLIFAAITFGALLFLSLFGLLFSLLYKNLSHPKKTKIWFLSLSVSSILAFLLYLLFGVIFGVF